MNNKTLPQGVEEFLAEHGVWADKVYAEHANFNQLKRYVAIDDLMNLLSGMAIVPKGHVPLPTNEEEAKTMALLGTDWLKNNAPHLLKNPDVPEGIALVPVEPKVSNWRDWRDGDLIECLQWKGSYFTKGKLYEVVGGNFTTDDGLNFSIRYVAMAGKFRLHSRSVLAATKETTK